MANNLLTINMITSAAMALFVNDNPLLKNVSKKLAKYFGKPDAQIGTTLNIRKRLDFNTRTGPTAQPQSTNEQEVTLTINTQAGVDVYFSSQDLALSLNMFTENVLRTMINSLVGQVAMGLMSSVETGVANLALGGSQTNTGGIPYMINYTANGINNPTAATASPTTLAVLEAAAYLDALSCPRDQRLLFLHPKTSAALVSTYSGLFNPQIKLSKQWETGLIAMDTLGFDKTLVEQTTLTHNVAAYGTLPTSNGAAQSGSTITVTALTAPLNVGDIITFGNSVDLVNRVTKADSGFVYQGVLTANAAIGATSISIYPPVIGPYANGAVQQYQTTTTTIANGTQLSAPIAASTTYLKNFAMHPSALEMVFAELPTNLPGAEASRESLDGASIRVAKYYAGATDQVSWRLDTLYGSVWTRPEWSVVLCGSLTNG